MHKNFEKLMALHDGEVETTNSSDSKKPFDDPESKALVEKIAQADKAFINASDELLSMPIPSKLVDAIRDAAPETTTAQTNQKATVIRFPSRRHVVGLAIAAGLATVIATNNQIFETQNAPETGDPMSGYLVLLQDAMNDMSSGDLLSSADQAVSIMPVVSFKTSEGELCREFIAREGEAEITGIACHSGSAVWQVRASEEQLLQNPASDGYSLAERESGISSLQLDARMAEQLSYEEELAAIRSGWTNLGL